MKLMRTPHSKMDNFRRKYVKLMRTPYLSMNHFRQKHVKLRPTPHSKMDNFRRKLMKLRRTPFLRVESVCLQSLVRSHKNMWNWGALLIWKLTIFDESPRLKFGQNCVHVRGERVNISRRGGRGLRFSLCRCSPSPFFAVPFSAEHPRSFRNASSNAKRKQFRKT